MIHETFQHIRRLQIKTTRKVDSMFAGDYRSAFKGVGLEFEDVREYQPGDEIQSIDWFVTAYMQNPYVKNFREERELTVMLAVDISASTRFGSSDKQKNEVIAEIGAILAFSAIKNHDKVGLLLFSDEIELYLKPRQSLRHVLRVIRELLYFKPAHKGTDIRSALAFLGRVQKRQTICFLISDFLAGDFFHEANIIAKRHDLILINIYDALEKKFPQIGLAEIADLETGERHLIDTVEQRQFVEQSAEREEWLKQQTKRIGASLLSIESHESVSDSLHQFFQLRGQSR